MTIPRKFDINYPVHVTSRAIEGRNIFADEEDCFRFIFQAYAANIGRPVHNIWRQDVIKAAKAILEGEEISSKFIIKEHEPLVSILDFSLVVNHNHLYLLSNAENSIPIFVGTLNNGFAHYYNLKHNRKGTLFDGPYRTVTTKAQFQADAVSRYISVINPLDVFQPGWREEGLTNPNEALEFLMNFQFSSFPDKIGKRRSKILAPPEILEKYLTLGTDIKSYQEFAVNFLKDRSNHPRELFLE
jgi:hypothetical protein